MKKAVIVSGGKIKDFSGLKKAAADFFAGGAPFTIAADSGVLAALEMGFSVDIAIGDFDSYRGDLPSGARLIKFPPEKSKTDTELAVCWALDNGYKNLLILGALGGRRDHEMANISLLAKVSSAGGEAVLQGRDNKIYITEGRLALKREEGFYISLFPLYEKALGVTITGAKYPLSDAVLKHGSTRAVSNEFAADEVVITVKKGPLLVVLSRD